MSAELANPLRPREGSCCDSNSRFTWKLPVEDWSNDKLNLRFETLLPQMFPWCLGVYPKGKNGDAKHIEVDLAMIGRFSDYDEDANTPMVPKFQMEIAYRIKKPNDRKPFDMYSSLSHSVYHSTEFEIGEHVVHPWICLKDSYEIGTAEERVENGFIIFQLGIRTFWTPEKTFQASSSKQKQMFRKKIEESFFDSGDVKIICDGEESSCHKLLLTSQSPVFRAMFAQDSKENAESTVLLDDSTPEAVEEFLFYLYHGILRQVPFTSAELDLVFDIVYLASKYQMDDLLQICKDVMTDIVSVDNVLKIMVVMEKYQTELWEISGRIFKFVKENIERIVKKEEWIEFVVSHPSMVTEILVIKK
eukprot:GFUD01032381.1.p1 GENE.GFUD01032381.1~~GFUD01032381.1.p1  ORF type:complete len:361 (-),score=86.81 GFUD01032381.1:95-1177(-)